MTPRVDGLSERGVQLASLPAAPTRFLEPTRL